MRKLKMTASELKAQYELHNPKGHFFSRENMRFSGDKMSNYYVPVEPVVIETPTGNMVHCYELQRRKPVKHGLIKSAYFSIDEFKHTHKTIN